MECWENILDQDELKLSLEFSALFVMYYECLKDYVVNQIKDFYCDELELEDGVLIQKETEKYKREVRSLSKNIDNASLKWFLQFQAISQEDYDNYQIIRKRRNELTHELFKNVCIGFTEKDVELFVSLITLFNKIDKWWINEIEIPICGDEVPDDYDRNGVCGSHALILSIMNDIILCDGGERYKTILEDFQKITR